MSFTTEIKENKKDSHKYIEIAGYKGNVKNLVVPEAIDSLPVEAIGNHAFSGRQDIESVTLPNTIRTLYGFAFHNCRNLKKITLYDSLDDYYDGVCRQCDSLEEIELTIERDWYEVARNFLADNDKTLRFRLHFSGGTALLTFPEYVYDFNENTMARTIQFSIAGSGMFYRESVDRRRVDYRGYDKLFEKARIDGGTIAEDIAIGRLLFPVELEDNFRQEYESFASGNAESILKRLIDEAAKDSFFDAKEMIKLLLEYKDGSLIPDEALHRALEYATSRKLTEVSALLMGKAPSAENTVPRFVL